MPEQEFGSDGQLHPVEARDVPRGDAEKRTAPADSFAASEPGAASQRDDLLMTVAHAVEHLTRLGTGKEHNEKIKAAIASAEPDQSKLGSG